MRRLGLFMIAAIGLLAMNAGPAAPAEGQGRDPFTPVDPDGRPIGVMRLLAGPGATLIFPIYALHDAAQAEGSANEFVRGTARIAFEGVFVLKAIDATTVRLWQFMVARQQVRRADIALCAPSVDCSFRGDGTGDPSPDAYLVITLEDASVVGRDTGGAPSPGRGDRDRFAGAIAERIRFDFGRITMRDAGGTMACWDAQQNRSC